MHSATCGLGKETKKVRKKDNGKLAIRPDHPRRHIGFATVIVYVHNTVAHKKLIFLFLQTSVISQMWR